ncbi:hypothetical protein EDB80DRAFT_59144 [Ilyonectria destructans]|nr:hypothetical protein EDB80DRAFT_59144 [Ilyonectria destructans]
MEGEAAPHWRQAMPIRVRPPSLSHRDSPSCPPFRLLGLWATGSTLKVSKRGSFSVGKPVFGDLRLKGIVILAGNRADSDGLGCLDGGARGAWGGCNSPMRPRDFALFFCDPRRDGPRRVRGLSQVLGTCEAESCKEGQREESDEPRALTKMASRVEAPLPLHRSRVGRCRLLRARRGIAQRGLPSTNPGICIVKGVIPRQSLQGLGRRLSRYRTVFAPSLRTTSADCNQTNSSPSPVYDAHCSIPASQHPSLSRCCPDHLQRPLPLLKRFQPLTFILLNRQLPSLPHDRSCGSLGQLVVDCPAARCRIGTCCGKPGWGRYPQTGSGRRRPPHCSPRPLKCTLKTPKIPRTHPDLPSIGWRIGAVGRRYQRVGRRSSR